MITTCVVVNYNDANTTRILIEQIKDYKCFDFLVIVDNCSTDDSYCQLKRLENNKIIVLKTSKNGGYGFGNNFGVTYSFEVLRAEYILIANPDVEFSEDTIIKLRNTLVKSPKLSIAAPVPYHLNGKVWDKIAWKLPTVIDEVLESSVIYNRLFGSRTVYKNSYYQNKKVVFVDVVQGSMLLLNANLMVEHGMYDEDFFLYCEEQVIGWKMKKQGFRTVLLLDESYIHKHSISINKEYKSIIGKKKLLLDSKLLYINKYLNANKNSIILVKVFFKLVLFETCLISFIKKLADRVSYKNIW